MDPRCGLLHWPTIIREEKATEWPSWKIPDRRKGWKDFQLVSLSARDLEFLLFFSEKIKLEMYGIIFIHSECFLIVVILRVIRFNLSRPSGLKKKWVHFEAIQNFSTSISRTHGTLDFVRKLFWSSPFVHIFENILNERRNQFPMGISSLSLHIWDLDQKISASFRGIRFLNRPFFLGEALSLCALNVRSL